MQQALTCAVFHQKVCVVLIHGLIAQSYTAEYATQAHLTQVDVAGHGLKLVSVVGAIVSKDVKCVLALAGRHRNNLQDDGFRWDNDCNGHIGQTCSCMCCDRTLRSNATNDCPLLAKYSFSDCLYLAISACVPWGT